MVTFSNVAKVSAILVKYLESQPGVALSMTEAEKIATGFDSEYDVAKLESIDQSVEALPTPLTRAAKADAKQAINQLIFEIQKRGVVSEVSPILQRYLGVDEEQASNLGRHFVDKQALDRLRRIVEAAEAAPEAESKAAKAAAKKKIESLVNALQQLETQLTAA